MMEYEGPFLYLVIGLVVYLQAQILWVSSISRGDCHSRPSLVYIMQCSSFDQLKCALESISAVEIGRLP